MNDKPSQNNPIQDFIIHKLSETLDVPSRDLSFLRHIPDERRHASHRRAVSPISSADTQIIPN